MIDLVLRSQGADVVSVGSVQEAMQIVSESRWKPEVLLSDLGMPDEDGYDLIRKVRLRKLEDGGEMPAIAITGYAGSEEVDRALKAGFQAHLTKPIDWNQLVKVIKSYTRNRTPGKSNGEG